MGVSLALLAVWAVLAVSGTARAKGKPGGGGGKNKSFITLNVTLEEPPTSDGIYSDGGGTYFNDEQRVMASAKTDGGFRFDTTGSQKIIDKNMERSVGFNFDGAAFTLTEGGELPNLPDDAMAGVDVRFVSANAI